MDENGLGAFEFFEEGTEEADGVEGVYGAEEGAGGVEDGKRKVGEGWGLFCSEFFEVGQDERKLVAWEFGITALYSMCFF